MDKSYKPSFIEKKIYESWESSGYFSPSNSGDPFCIVIPPPNVTGTLHMGHAFQDTIMDILVRYHRMQGKNTLWQVGTDHAGIATQMVVERQLELSGTSRLELGREAFITKVWDWKNKSGSTISNQLKRMGSSTDWTKERFTMDDDLMEGVQEVFIRLYEDKLIYRGKRLVNWDPVLLTALSDLEVIQSEESGNIWYFKYPIEESNESLVVATTRPETMLGDTAVAIHPNDRRYKKYIGKNIILPISERLIPIIADDYVDQTFGSGCVKITPAHDFNDFEIGKRHGLEVINIFTKDAKINTTAQKKYIGMDRFEARNAIVSDMEKLGLLEKIEDYTLSVPRGDRSGTILEPYITDQWYVSTKKLAQPAIDIVKSGELNFVPHNWSKTYFEWMENIQDWCISRQLWWGHRIPAWYDNQGEVYVGKSEEDVRKQYNLQTSIKLKQDEDVLDTWFSSALWPFSSLGWPNQTRDLETFYPTNVLVTGFDIIFFWVARMIMMGLYFMDDLPFKEVYIHGLVRDKNGQKMSKSKGNILDPIDIIDGIDLDTLIDKRTEGLMQPEMAPKIIKETKKEFPKGIPEFGVDALRFTFAIQATTGRDIRFDLNRIEGYKNFCNKLWNAARFVQMNTDGIILDSHSLQKENLSIPDLWIQSKLQLLLKSIEKNIKIYRIDLMATSLYEFVWNDFCDWYIEFSKSIFNSVDDFSENNKHRTKENLLYVLDSLLRALHPIIPFITEEIWTSFNFKTSKKSIMVSTYPKKENLFYDETVIKKVEWIQSFVTNIRQIRSEMNIAPKVKIPIFLQDASQKDLTLLNEVNVFIRDIANIGEIKIINDTPPISAISLLGEMKIHIPLEGLIDIESERKRLEKKLVGIQKNLHSVNQRLENKNFKSKAPKDVVEKLTSQYELFSKDKIKIEQQIKMMSLS